MPRLGRKQILPTINMLELDSNIISSIATSVGKSVSKGDKIAVLEAMKMQTTIYASCDGKIEEILVDVGTRLNQKI